MLSAISALAMTAVVAPNCCAKFKFARIFSRFAGAKRCRLGVST